MVECSREKLHIYLDGEMNACDKRILEEHLRGCRDCRREMARLQLLWLQLGQPCEVELPQELPYIRQQVLWQVAGDSRKAPGHNFWDTQKLAWEPALSGVRYLPGMGLVSSLTRSGLRQVPKAFSAAVSLAWRAASQRGDKKKGGSR